MVGEKVEKKLDPLEEELSKMSDQELIGIVRSKSDVLQDQCFDPWDLIVLGYTMLELEKRGYCVEFSIQTGIEKCPCRQNGGGADE